MSAAVSTSPSPSPVVWTVRELLGWTTTYLGQKGIESPRLESHILLAHVLKCPRIELIARSDEEPTANQKAAYRELVKRRVDGWPVAYLTGVKEFYLLPFHVSPAVLIPRPDTETLVLEALNKLKGRANPTVLDLGTGSGCVAVAIAANAPSCRVTAVDVSPDAADVAKKNATANAVADRVTVLTGDLFAPVPAVATFDVLVSNPPYVTPAEIETLAPDVRDHEPRLALDGGPDGLAFYRRIVAGAGAIVKSGGWVLLEVGHTQAGAVNALFAARPEFDVKPTVKDAGGRLRVVVVTRK